MSLDKLFDGNEQMVIAATRYCLGRMTYIVSECCDWLIKIWPELSIEVQTVIRRDIEEAFARDDEAREFSMQYFPLGMDCDRQQWERVRRLWQ